MSLRILLEQMCRKGGEFKTACYIKVHNVYFELGQRGDSELTILALGFGECFLST